MSAWPAAYTGTYFISSAGEQLTLNQRVPGSNPGWSTMKHAWKLDEDGEVDLLAVSSDAFPYCQGPSCSRCWEYFCVSCETSDLMELAILLTAPCVDNKNPNQLELEYGSA